MMSLYYGEAGRITVFRIRERWTGGDAAFLIRAARVMEKSQGLRKTVQAGCILLCRERMKKSLCDIPIIINNYWHMDLPEKKMRASLFTGAGGNGILTFIHFIFFFRQKGLLRSLGNRRFYGEPGSGVDSMAGFFLYEKQSGPLPSNSEASSLKPYRFGGRI